MRNGGVRQLVRMERLPLFLGQIRAAASDAERLVFVCIGTDRSTGDALGPLVGTQLEEAGFRVIGTMKQPCDAGNLAERLREIEPGQTVVAIDACLGRADAVGACWAGRRPVAPGKALGKLLPPVGEYSIAAVVNAEGPRPYSILQHTSLHMVMEMAKAIAEAIQQTWPPAAQIGDSGEQ